MAQWKTAASSAAAVSFYLTGTAAFADVTAEQVWNDWKSYMTGFGYTLDASENFSGGVLTVENLEMNFVVPEDGSSMKIGMEQFKFTDNGDGTVSMTVPPELPISIKIDAIEGEDVDAVIDYNTSGYSVVISGQPDDMTYNYSVAQLSMALANLVVDGTPIETGSASMTIADITGSANMKTGAMRSSTQRMNTGPISFDLDMSDPEGPGEMQISGKYDSLGFTGGATIPSEMNSQDMSAMLEAGFGFDGAFSFGPGGANFTFTEEQQAVDGSSSSGGGTLDIALNGGELRYGGQATDYQIKMSGGELPFPVEMAMQRFGFNLLMPVSSDDAEQDFAFGVTLGDFTMSDLLWSVFDPASQLPRDPATVALDLTGKVKLLVDLMDPKAMEAVDAGETIPGELNALDLNDLTISLAGAELTGEGSFTFDNSDMTTFGGMPAPTGAIDLQLVGGNGLLDKLVAMGFVPEDQAMGARMMMGMFAVPGQGEDTLTSKIEVTGDGQVKANGQRLR